MKVFYSNDHLGHCPRYYFPEGGPLELFYETPARAEGVLAALRKRDWAEIAPPADFGLAPIRAVHSARYLDYLRAAYADWQPYSPIERQAFIPGSFTVDRQAALSGSVPEQAGSFLMSLHTPITTGTYAAALASAQCALSGAAAVTQGERAAFALCRPPGHHAGREICGGFCFLNNAAIAAQWLSARGKVAILDIDFHAGNGTQDIFYARADVLTVSLHADPGREYPHYAGYADETGAGPGTGCHRNFPLPAGTDDTRYLRTLEDALGLIAQFSPTHLVVSAGMDIYKDDPLGDFAITHQGIAAIGRAIAGLNLPTLVVMEGGYAVEALGGNVASLLEAFVHS
jgi:acetoin utilization deacetylase AcuC-like enzyme